MQQPVLVFEVEKTATPVFYHQVRVRKCRLRLLVEHSLAGVGGRVAKVNVIFLDVLAVIAFGAGQIKQALLQYRAISVPEHQGKAEILVPVGNPGQAVFSPTIRPARCTFTGEILPSAAVWAVVFPDRSPSPLAQIRSSLFPVCAGYFGTFYSFDVELSMMSMNL